MRKRPLAFVVRLGVLALMASCDREKPAAQAVERSPETLLSTKKTELRALPPAPRASATQAAVAPPSAPVSTGSCKLLQGPLALSVTGPVTLVAGPTKGAPPLAIFNAAGSPLLASIVSKKPSAGEPEPPRGSTPACVIDDGDAFCMTHSGQIRRMPLDGGDLSLIHI